MSRFESVASEAETEAKVEAHVNRLPFCHPPEPLDTSMPQGQEPEEQLSESTEQSEPEHQEQQG